MGGLGDRVGACTARGNPAWGQLCWEVCVKVGSGPGIKGVGQVQGGEICDLSRGATRGKISGSADKLITPIIHFLNN